MAQDFQLDPHLVSILRLGLTPIIILTGSAQLGPPPYLLQFIHYLPVPTHQINFIPQAFILILGFDPLLMVLNPESFSHPSFLLHRSLNLHSCLMSRYLYLFFSISPWVILDFFFSSCPHPNNKALHFPLISCVVRFIS